MTDIRKENGTEQLVGGKVPDKYNRVSNTDKNATENTQRTIRQQKHSKNQRCEEIQYTLNDPIWDKRWTDELD